MYTYKPFNTRYVLRGQINKPVDLGRKRPRPERTQWASIDCMWQYQDATLSQQS